MRAFVAAARHGGIPLQQNGKWLIFGKDSRAALRKSPISTGRRFALLLCTARVSLVGRPGGRHSSLPLRGGGKRGEGALVHAVCRIRHARRPKPDRSARRGGYRRGGAVCRCPP